MNANMSLCALLLLAASCKSSADKTPAPPTAPDPVAAAPAAPAPQTAEPVPAAEPVAANLAGPPKPWKDMTIEERGKYMKEVVAPKMKVAFQEFDADEFKKFSCETCHGEEPKKRKFAMPNPDLYMLPATAAAFAPLMEKKPKMMKFMAEVVKPQMATLLGLREFDPKKPEAGGFGCAACHTSKPN